MVWNALILALREIRRNLLRSFLTVLGIVIGVAAVITMVTIGSGATAQVTADIATLGSNLLMVRPGARMGPGQMVAAKPFDIKDAEAIARDIPGIRAVAPIASSSLVAVVGNENWSTSVTGATNAIFTVRSWSFASGRPFTESEQRSGMTVCVVGETVRQELFGSIDPVGARMRLGKFSCEVVGLLESKGETGMGQDQDNVVILPLRAFWRRVAGNQDVSLIQVSARDGVDTTKVQEALVYLFRERRHISSNEDDNFMVMDMKEITKTLTNTTKILTALLGSIAAVSLLVGGIGIMNIMLVSVTERTREIGIRLAIGALEREVLLQFLVEAVVLASFGGVIGIVLALIGSSFLAGLLGVPFVVDPSIILFAFAFSAMVGVFFGYFPARKAARLNPIDALRHE